MKRCWLILPSFFILHVHGFAQGIKVDTAFLAQASQEGMAVYSKAMRAQSHLYNGTEYRGFQSSEEVHPYLINDWTDGSIYYDGELEQNVPLLYDLSGDWVITEHYSSGQKIQLVTDKVEYFILPNHLFVHLRDPRLQEGFYELIYNGTSKVYVRKQKSLQQNVSGAELVKYFDEKTAYYVFTEGDFHLVKNKRDVLRAFNKRKSEVNQFMSKNKITFKENKGNSIARTAEYYDSIHP